MVEGPRPPRHSPRGGEDASGLPRTAAPELLLIHFLVHIRVVHLLAGAGLEQSLLQQRTLAVGCARQHSGKHR